MREKLLIRVADIKQVRFDRRGIGLARLTLALNGSSRGFDFNILNSKKTLARLPKI
jgi:hypothetical protein